MAAVLCVCVFRSRMENTSKGESISRISIHVSIARGKIKYFLQKGEPPQALPVRDDIFSRLDSLSTQGKLFFSLSHHKTWHLRKIMALPNLQRLNRPSLAEGGFLSFHSPIFIYRPMYPIYTFSRVPQNLAISKTFLLHKQIVTLQCLQHMNSAE